MSFYEKGLVELCEGLASLLEGSSAVVNCSSVEGNGSFACVLSRGW